MLPTRSHLFRYAAEGQPSIYLRTSCSIYGADVKTSLAIPLENSPEFSRLVFRTHIVCLENDRCMSIGHPQMVGLTKTAAKAALHASHYFSGKTPTQGIILSETLFEFLRLVLWIRLKLRFFAYLRDEKCFAFSTQDGGTTPIQLFQVVCWLCRRLFFLLRLLRLSFCWIGFGGGRMGGWRLLLSWHRCLLRLLLLLHFRRL